MRADTRQAPLIKLSDRTLRDLPTKVLRPAYDRSALTPGIIHVGLGNFHRAHQAWYLHRLMQAGKALDWAIIGAGVRPGDAVMRDKLRKQDYLTTLIELDPRDIAVEVTGAMVDFLPVEPGNAPLIKAMNAPSIHIVALTVTEGGYFLGPENGFDMSHPDIAHDIEHPEAPVTVFGAVVAALKMRKAAGCAPFTVLSCDNLQGNGTITRNAVVTLARATDSSLADWIDRNGAFPNSMVDCIVPATGPKEIALARSFGIEDTAPVTHENFRQWVIEDTFCAGRPPLEDVGVTMTSDVHAFEAMKLRILNGGHQLLANVGELLGLQTIADSMSHQKVAAFFHQTQNDEITPYVQAVPGTSAAEYLAQVTTRFANTAIHDTNRRVAFDGSSRHPGFLLPSVRDALAADAGVSGLALAEAFWARMCAGTREDGSVIEPNDPNWAALTQAADLARTTPSVWLAQRALYGDLADTRFAVEFEKWLSLVWTEGTEAVLERFLAP
ncbi:MAG: mannitol dehydrogenase family protein [Dinoroseobacter sp.]|nr:mannitol dehydrogenase family protein [Dinoroseobacter sp.]